MKYIFCNLKNPIDVSLAKRDDVIYFNGSATDITEYYNNNTVIVMPYKEKGETFGIPQYGPSAPAVGGGAPKYEHSATLAGAPNKRKELQKIINENKMNLEEIGTAVWVPIDKEKNYGIVFTSTENTYWAWVSVMGLIDKFSFKIDTVILDANDFYLIKFEEQILKAMAVQKKLDFAPDIHNIYFNP